MGRFYQLEFNIPIFPDGNYTEFNKSPPELFRLFFDDELLDLIAHESNLYATHTDGVNPMISRADLLRFIGIIIISGYAVLPASRMMWSTKDDTFNKMVSESMSLNPFKLISKSFISHRKKNSMPTIRCGNCVPSPTD